MNSQTKILIIRSKELLYTVIISLLIIFTIIMLVLIFGKKNNSGKDDTSNIGSNKTSYTYTPGVYTSDLVIGGNELSLKVTVDADQICSISLLNTNEYVETMYPLLSSSLESLSKQICTNNSTDNIQFDEGNQYTSMLLLDAINEALKNARK